MRSKFSCTGKNLDFMAPGQHIFSTIPHNWYAYMDGTSMACPFVTGLAALALSYVRNHNPKIQLKTAEDFRKILSKHTLSINDALCANNKFFQGFGIINTKEFLKWTNN